MSRYSVGIDLGTTNSALAYIDCNGGQPVLQTQAITQLVRPWEWEAFPMLPSFLYLGGGPELPPGATSLPWSQNEINAVGEFARRQGLLVPSRQISSAKSWLCHPGVDRLAPLLPYSHLPGIKKLSPVEVSTRYLRHLADSWNHQASQGKVHGQLEQQEIVLTVPASFDDVARNLTLESAKRAGLQHITMLEEPQAAFYRWLATQSLTQKSIHLETGMLCLVIDVGGGTTDFTLIELIEEEGELGFSRKAVGNHLLLGGDNMDLALAKFAEGRFGGKNLDGVRFSQLVAQCRDAKERMLGENPTPKIQITLTGRGASVIGGTQVTQLDRDEIENLVIEGFFPFAGPNSNLAKKEEGAGLHEFGLPYETDAAITRHLAAFLREQAEGGVLPAPAALLFNGGVFRSKKLQLRILKVLETWFSKEWNPVVLENPSVDLAVAEGAAWFGWLKRTGKKRIRGGTGKSYYLGLASQNDQEQLLCVLPRNHEEGLQLVLSQPKLELAVGQPVAFPLFTSTVRGHDQPGQVLAIPKKQLHSLPPLQTVLKGGRKAGAKLVPVSLAAQATPIGTLELQLQAEEGGNQWKLEFNVRDTLDPEQEEGDSKEQATWPTEPIDQACEALQSSFLSGIPSLKDLPGEMEKCMEASRDEWPLSACRKIWDQLISLSQLKNRSISHSTRWTNLAGYLLRPGFGAPGDKTRIENLWKELQGPQREEGRGAGSYKALETGADIWILWRRIAGGLGANLQSALFDRVKAVLLPNPNRSATRPPANEWIEMWRAAASFERLPPQIREDLGNILIKGLNKQPLGAHLLWSLTRLGARTMVHGPLNSILHPDAISPWLEKLILFSPNHRSEELGWGFCLSQLARITGQRALDICPDLRKKVLEKILPAAVPEEWKLSLQSYVPLAKEAQSNLLGDSLPGGLRLAGW